MYHFRLELFPPSRNRPRTSTRKPGITFTTASHNDEYLSTQSSLTQETGFFSNPSLPISAVVADIDEEIGQSFDQF